LAASCCGYLFLFLKISQRKNACAGKEEKQYEIWVGCNNQDLYIVHVVHKVCVLARTTGVLCPKPYHNIQKRRETKGEGVSKSSCGE
jgi:hypothetical protein